MAFPSNFDSFTTKNAGDTISETHINNLQIPVVSIEQKVGSGASTASTNTALLGTGASTTGYAVINLANTALVTGLLPNAVYTNASNNFSLINPLVTPAESWIGPSSTTGIYFKSGNVGIGTPAPGALLNMAGGLNSGLIILQSSSNTEGNQAALLMNAVNVNGHSGNVSVGAISINNQQPDMVFRTGATTLTAFGTERMRITTAGNVGIGTATPVYLLDVNGICNATHRGDGSNLTALNAANISSGTLPTARGGTGSTAAANAANGAVVLDGSGNIVSPIKTTAQLGAWDNTKAFNTVYQAATDGFVVGWTTLSQSYYQYGVTDSGNPPTTERFRSSVGGSAGPDNFVPFFMPVRKNDYWKIGSTSYGSGIVFWIPLGA